MSAPGENKSTYYIQATKDNTLVFTEDEYCQNCYVADVADGPRDGYTVTVRRQDENPLAPIEITQKLPGIQQAIVEFSAKGGPTLRDADYLCPAGTQCYRTSVEGPTDGVYMATVRAPTTVSAPAAPPTAAAPVPAAAAAPPAAPTKSGAQRIMDLSAQAQTPAVQAKTLANLQKRSGAEQIAPTKNSPAAPVSAWKRLFTRKRKNTKEAAPYTKLNEEEALNMQNNPMRKPRSGGRRKTRRA
jgi:hypothetical protein